MANVCTLFREDDHFRRFFAMLSWFLKLVTLIVFFATIRLHDQQRGVQEVDGQAHENMEDEAPLPRRPNYPRRHRRVAYRPRPAAAG